MLQRLYIVSIFIVCIVNIRFRVVFIQCFRIGPVESLSGVTVDKFEDLGSKGSAYFSHQLCMGFHVVDPALEQITYCRPNH